MAKITGTKRNDKLVGTNSNDELFGLEGNDTLDGLGGIDTMVGGIGNDIYIVDNIAEKLTEKAKEGTDLVNASVSFTLAANLENLTLTGTKAIDGTGNTSINVLTGNGANNVLDGKAGADKMLGGKGNDTYVVDNAGDKITEKAKEGTDTVNASVSYTLAAEVEKLVLTGTKAINATGNAAANTLTGNNANNVLDGKTSADTMVGGLGNDTYVVDNTGDKVTEAANGGTDTVRSSISHTLGNNVENLVLTGAGDINGDGNSAANTLTGNSGANFLDGKAGADTMAGGAGDDTYVVDNAGDVVTEGLDKGADTVNASITYTLTANVEDLSLTGNAAIDGTGNGLDNSIQGNDAANVIDGGLGADDMAAGDGDDTYVVDNVGDTVTESENKGNDLVQSSVTYTLSDHVERLELTGELAINGTGNALVNTITGNGAANVLDGGAGADTMIGGAGSDAYVVDDAGDIATEAVDEGTADTVSSSVTYTLTANVENLNLTGDLAINGTGNELDNVINGNAEANVFDGGLGADTMTGGAGDDTYIVDNVGDVTTEEVDQGTDLVRSSVTWELLYNFENLTLTGNGNINGTGNNVNNIITGNEGNNELDGSIGDDTLAGGAGDDTYILADGNDVVDDSSGTDTIQSTITRSLADYTSIENLTLLGVGAINATGNEFANTLTGNAAVNVLTGEDGNDTLIGGLGTDTLYGGADDDTYIIDDDASDVIFDTSGIDTIGSTITRTLASFSNIENITLLGTDNINATGDSGDNVLTGNSGNNTLDGGDGQDQLIGGDGDDTYVLTNSTDTVEDSSGTDTITSTVSRTLLSYLSIENLTLLGTALNGTGNDLDNTIIGSAVNNMLFGGLGNDTLDGGVGTDTLDGSDGDDVYVVDNVGDSIVDSSGTDTIRSKISYTLASNLENLTLLGTADLDATGNASSNYMVGNSGNNVLDAGGAGSDVMIGGAGNDTYILGNSAATVIELDDEGIDTIISSTVEIELYSLSYNVENITLTGSSSIGAYANNLDNVITGNAGDNIIDGYFGNDTLTGGDGNDVFRFWNFPGGNTTLGYDTITDFEAGAGAGDVLRVGQQFTSLTQLLNQNRIVDDGFGNCVITFDAVAISLDPTSTITLLGVTKNQLVADDFDFNL